MKVDLPEKNPDNLLWVMPAKGEINFEEAALLK
jgi:hypothetical protein